VLSVAINTSSGLTQGCRAAFWGGQQNVATLESSKDGKESCCCPTVLLLSDWKQQNGILDGSERRVEGERKRFLLLSVMKSALKMLMMVQRQSLV
jgi:hypothetical protein